MTNNVDDYIASSVSLSSLQQEVRAMTDFDRGYEQGLRTGSEEAGIFQWETPQFKKGLRAGARQHYKDKAHEEHKERKRREREDRSSSYSSSSSSGSSSYSSTVSKSGQTTESSGVTPYLLAAITIVLVIAFAYGGSQKQDTERAYKPVYSTEEPKPQNHSVSTLTSAQSPHSEAVSESEKGNNPQQANIGIAKHDLYVYRAPNNGIVLQLPRRTPLKWAEQKVSADGRTWFKIKAGDIVGWIDAQNVEIGATETSARESLRSNPTEKRFSYQKVTRPDKAHK